MSTATPVRETREVLIQRAKEAMKRAEAEPLPQRARIHIEAAETWLRLAARKPKREADAANETAQVQGVV